jgi:hypothetical protein
MSAVTVGAIKTATAKTNTTTVAREHDRTACGRAAGTARPPALGNPSPPRAFGQFAPFARTVRTARPESGYEDAEKRTKASVLSRDDELGEVAQVVQRGRVRGVYPIEGGQRRVGLLVSEFVRFVRAEVGHLDD